MSPAVGLRERARTFIASSSLVAASDACHGALAAVGLRRRSGNNKPASASGGSNTDTDEEVDTCTTAVGSILSATTTRHKLEVLEEDVQSGNGVKIICVGVMRTGLKSLHRALRNMGYTNIYDQEEIVSTYELWDQVLRNKGTKDVFGAIFRGAEVIMGIPTFCFWEQLVDLYPDAKIILTVRDENQWWESVRYAETLMHHDLPGAPMRYGSTMRWLERVLVPSYHKFCEVLRFAWATTLGAHALDNENVNEAVARSSYRKHNSYVTSVLGGQKTSRGEPKLLVYDVHQGWGPLCEFLGKEEPEVDFPSMLQVPYFPGSGFEDGKGGRMSFEDMVLPDSDFGLRMRQELRLGLAKGLALVLPLAMLSAVLLTWEFEMPLLFIALGQLVVLTVGWNVYVVMHGLILRVPALVVLPMAIKSLLIATALQVCFISYGILKEMLVTQDHIASPVLVLSSRFGAIVCSFLFLGVTEGRISFGAPLHAMGAFAFTNEASTWAGYEMLKYVSFPVQVMAKSVKMLPSMLMGRIINGTQYTFYQYLQAFAALICVVIMNFTDTDTHNANKEQVTDSPEKATTNTYYKVAMGSFILVVFFVCDGFTSQWQTALYRKHPGLTRTQMMLGGNLLGFILTSSTLFAAWPKVKQSMAVALQRPEVMGRIVSLGLVYAVGQFCIYSAICILGPLSFNWIMTARQLLSVLISLVFFGHGINVTKVVCIFVVFGIMSAKQLQKAVPKIIDHAGHLRKAISKRTLTTA